MNLCFCDLYLQIFTVSEVKIKNLKEIPIISNDNTKPITCSNINNMFT